MSYSINYSDLSKFPIVIEDGTIDTTTDISLLGKSVSSYGRFVAQNFLHLLENFASPTEPENPISGQLWYDSANDLLKYYTKNGEWKTASAKTVTNEPPPEISGNTTINYTSVEGDIWYDTSTNNLYIYNGTEWINIIQFDDENRVLINTRYDNTGVLHKTMEFLLNNKLVYLLSTDNDPWIPSSVGTTAESMQDGRLLIADYPVIKKGINLNSDTTYDLHNYFVKLLTELTIDVGNGSVLLEDNALDGAGPGFTLRPQTAPANTDSIFSIRNTNNTSKLWVGTENTTVGTNGLAVGFTGSAGTESVLNNYNIVLNANGTISGSSLQMSNGGTFGGNVSSTGNISAAQATGDWIAVEADMDAKTSTTKIVTPAMLDYSLLNVYANEEQFSPSTYELMAVLTPQSFGFSIATISNLDFTPYRSAVLELYNIGYGTFSGQEDPQPSVFVLGPQGGTLVTAIPLGFGNLFSSIINLDFNNPLYTNSSTRFGITKDTTAISFGVSSPDSSGWSITSIGYIRLYGIT
jgi:hypothetical protein